MKVNHQMIEDDFETLFALVPDAACVLNEKGAFKVVNEKFAMIFNHKKEDFVEKTILDINLPEEETNNLQEILQSTMKGLVSDPRLMQVKAINGCCQKLEMRTKKILYGKKSAVLFIFQNLSKGLINSEQPQYPGSVKSNIREDIERTIASIFESSPDAITVSDVYGRLIICNQAALDLLGFSSKDEILVKSSLELISPTDHHRALQAMAQSLKTGYVKNLELTFMTKTGNPLPAECSINIIKDAAGTPILFVIITRDVTERKKAHEDLARSEERLKLTLEAVNDGIWDWDIPSGNAFFNPGYYTMLGYDPYEFPQNYANWKSKIHPDDVERVEREINEAIEKDKGYAIEFRMRAKSGGWRWILTRGKTVGWDSQRKPVRMVGTHKDITDRKLAQQVLSDSEEKHRRLFEESIDAIFLTDTETGKIVDCNTAASKLVGREKSELIGQHQSLIHPLTSNEKGFTKEFKEHVSNPALPVETQVITKTGETKYVSIKANVFELKGQKLIQGVFRDITDLKKANEKLLNLKEFDERINDSLGDALLIVDPEDFTILNANRVAHEQLKLERKDMIGKTCYETTHSSSTPCEAPKHICPIRETKNTGKPVYVEHTHLDSQQNEVIVEISVYPVKNEQGKTVVVHIAKDITKRKIMERELKESETKFRTITNSVRDAIILVDDQTKVTYWNPAAETIFGYSVKEAIGKDVHELVVPPTMSQAGKDYIKIGVKAFAGTGLGNFTSGNVELVGLRKDGREFPAKISLSPVYLHGKWNAVGVVKDITERKQAEQKLREAEKRYHALFNQAPLGVLVIDPRTQKIVEFNDVAHNQLGYSREEFSKLFISDFEAMKTKDEIKAEITNVLTNGEDEFETKHYCKNGEIRNVIVTISAVELEGKPFFDCIFHDITEIRKVQNALMESETKYRQLVNVAQEGIWAFDNNYRTVYANPQIVQMLGYSESELSGKNLDEFLDETNIEKTKHLLAKYTDGAKGGQFECKLKRKNNSWIYAGIVASPLKDDNGNAVGMLAVVSDITERKTLERKVSNYSKHLKSMVELRTVQLKAANEQLVKSERLAAIGELAGMVGHDLRNPLSAIKNATYYLKKKGTTISETQSKEMLETIDKSIEHSDKIINDLLEYAREMHFELTKYDAHSLVEEALRMIQVPDRIQIVNDVQEKTWIWVNSDKMMRVFTNLIKNAIDAIPNKGTLEISSRQTEDNIAISFADTGMGIPEETLQKLFTPLFTTKAQGMGFGLAICKRIVEAHSGSIKVETEVNKGTTFTITLPFKPKTGVGGEKIWINMPESLLLTTTKT